MKHIIATLLVLSSVPAAANDDMYIDLGLGKSNFHQVETEGWWRFRYYSNEFDGDSNAISIALGKKLSDRYAIELGYIDLGKSDGFSGATQPDTTYDMKAANCNPCNPTEWYWLHQEIKAYTVSGIGRLTKGKWSLYGRLGGYYAKTKFTAMYQRHTEHDGTEERTPDPYGRFARRNVYHDDVFGIYYAIGASYKRLSFEYQEYPNIGGPEHPAHDVSAFMLSYRVSF